MKYLKTYEFFYIDRPVNYGGGTDPYQLNKISMLDCKWVYSELNDKYYSYDELLDLEDKWHKYCVQNDIEDHIGQITDTKILDYVLDKI